VLGRSLQLTGHVAYIRSNSLRLLAFYNVIDDPPPIFGQTALTPPIPTDADASSRLIQLALNTADEWNNQNDGALLSFVARPQNASQTRHHGSYILAHVTPGVFGFPSPTTVFLSPFRFAATQRLYLRNRAIDADGRISAAWTSTILATP
jgi:hypothetical protein